VRTAEDFPHRGYVSVIYATYFSTFSDNFWLCAWKRRWITFRVCDT